MWKSFVSGEREQAVTSFRVAKRVKDVLAEFVGKRQQFAGIPGRNRPLKQSSILMELSDRTQPSGPILV